MTERFRTLVPAALFVAAWPLGELGGAATDALGLHPLAFLALLAGIAAAVGAADGWSVRSAAAQAAAGGFPLPMTANRVRGAAAMAAFGAAAIAAAVLSDEVRTRWNVAREDAVRRELAALPHGGVRWWRIPRRGEGLGYGGPAADAADLKRTVRTARKRIAAWRRDAGRPDAYVRGVAARTGIAAPEWFTLAVYRGFPLPAGLLAAAIAWRVARPPEVPAEPA